MENYCENGWIKSNFLTLVIILAEQVGFFLICWGLGAALGATDVLSAITDTIIFVSFAIIIVGLVIFGICPIAPLGWHLLSWGFGWIATIPAIPFVITMLTARGEVPLPFIIIYGSVCLVIWIIYAHTLYRLIRD